MSVMPARPATRRVRTALAALVVAGLTVTALAGPASADEDGPVAGTSLPVVTLPTPDSGTRPMATIEDAEEFCSWMTGIYDSKPSSFTVRTVNCRTTDVFVKGVYRNGGFGPCVLVPARHSRHLGGSLLKPLEKSQIC
ncbi:hypothetical protein ACTHAM_002817 [Cellulomonas soli]|uniref:hypothetical protein n=1 Tax=Cellulomonas soli TaxID=931535 RepID=UPI003F852127